MHRPRATTLIVCAAASAVCLFAAACGSSGGGRSADTSSRPASTDAGTPSTRPKSHLPAGGVRKIVRDGGGRAILAVVYDVLGHLRATAVQGASPPAGRRFVAVHMAIENIGKGYYLRNPVTSATARDEHGHAYRALRSVKVRSGMHKLHLAPGEARGGLVVFVVPKTARLRVFSFKPFSSGRRAVYRLK